MGVEIYPGFAASEILFNDDDSIKGIATNEYNDYSLNSDSQLRTNTSSNVLSKEKLNFYKENFNKLCRA